MTSPRPVEQLCQPQMRDINGELHYAPTPECIQEKCADTYMGSYQGQAYLMCEQWTDQLVVQAQPVENFCQPQMRDINGEPHFAPTPECIEQQCADTYLGSYQGQTALMCYPYIGPQPPARTSLSQVIKGALKQNNTAEETTLCSQSTCQTITAAELGKIWSAMSIEHRSEWSDYKNFVDQVKSSQVILAPTARNLLFGVSGSILVDQLNSSLHAMSDQVSERDSFVFAVLDSFSAYKQQRAKDLVLNGQQTVTYRGTYNGAAYSASIYFEAEPFPFQKLSSSAAMSINLNNAQHYVIEKPEAQALQELRQLAALDQTEEAWLQVVVQVGGGAKSYFYEIGDTERAGSVKHNPSMLDAAMDHAQRQGSIIRADFYHIHPGAVYTWSPPSNTDVKSLQSTAQRFQGKWPQLPLIRDRIISAKRDWQLSITPNGVSASSSRVNAHADQAMKCMREVDSITEVSACYSNQDYRMTYRDL